MLLKLLLLLSLLTGSCNTLYFQIYEKDKKCFLEEIPEDTTIIGSYLLETFNHKLQSWVRTGDEYGIHVEIVGPEEDQILSKEYKSEGKFSFTSNTAGDHTICLKSTSDKWIGSSAQLRVHLDIKSGEHTVDYKQIATKEKLDDLQLRIRQLLEHVEQISKEQNYQRLREERFRVTSESTNARVLWWSLGQVIIVLLAAYLQIRHLKSFFEAKKLV